MFNKKQKIVFYISIFIAVAGLFLWPVILRFINPVTSQNISKVSSAYNPSPVLSDSLRQIIVVMENIPPYSFIENDSAGGFDVELSRAIFQKMKIRPVYKTYIWSRCLELVKNKDADAILTVFLTPERENFLYFPDEFCSYEPNAFFTLKESNVAYTGHLSDMKRIKIGVKSNTSYGFQFDRADFLEKDTSRDQETLIHKIIEKRLEVGIGSIPVISYISKQMNQFDKITFLKPFVTVDPMYIAFSKKEGNDLIASQFSKELKEFKKSLSYSYLLKKYGIINTVAK